MDRRSDLFCPETDLKKSAGMQLNQKSREDIIRILLENRGVRTKKEMEEFYDAYKQNGVFKIK